MKKCHVVYLVCTAAMIGTGLGAAPASAGHMTHVVHPGESIQKAVDAADSDDTVLVAPGTYRESVQVSTPGLTLRGMGRGTVIMPSTEKAAAADTCAEGGNGICVTGTKDENVKGVTVANLTVTGFKRTGLFSRATDGLTVRNVTAVKNGVWGIAQERSIHGTFRDNTARDNGDAGIFLANTINAEEGAADTQGTVVEHNRVEGNRIGVTVRRLRNLAVADNYIGGNCAGVFVVGDENKPKAGDLVVRDNYVVRNNKSCPKTDRLEALQGSGIVLTGAEKVLVADNTVEGNAGKSSMSGGIVLAKSVVGAGNSDNEVNGNRLRDNSPADLVHPETGDTAKTNTFEGNTCGASKPAGLC
ncbi:right-handed parallel beta-helix repeat-containing protein [Streptomyces sp. E2N166]|uniref:right-handed parallel beta-helix repeat-containing protein n=1 Tax=Streptomyces sp. E2N166 TaxID=1851909 RepID=UPI000EF7464E|nr:right-handed parallel beta-helix repeat-containing protein [Streptomyces sp. E2N166]